jgi:hypothetical protein
MGIFRLHTSGSFLLLVLIWFGTIIMTAQSFIPSGRRPTQRHGYFDWNRIAADASESFITSCSFGKGRYYHQDQRSTTKSQSLSSFQQEKDQHQDAQKQQQQQQQQEQLLLDDMRKTFQETFDRWRFLQRLLAVDDSDDNAVNQQLFTTTEQLLHVVLQGFLLQHWPSCWDERDDDRHAASIISTSSIDCPNWLTSNLLQLLKQKLQPYHHSNNEVGGHNWSLPVFSSTPPVMTRILPSSEDDDNHSTLSSSSTTTTMSWIDWLEELLPNPQDDEDAYNSLWDVVMELHGREAVKDDMKNSNDTSSSTSNWTIRCLIVRVLIHFDFLTQGILL